MLILFKQTEQDLNMIFVNVIDFIVIREKINETDMNEESQSKIKLSRGDILIWLRYFIKLWSIPSLSSHTVNSLYFK